MKKGYYSRTERILWIVSASLIIATHFLFKSDTYLSLIASLIGSASLIFNAKGNPLGQFLMLIFSVLYGIISYTFSYYGEMLTYLGMTAPMALFALISWLKHPYKGNRAVVEVNAFRKREWAFLSVLSLAVTLIFYFPLAYFNTANLIPSTLSVTTSFAAVYLTFRRSAYFALAYAVNDMVLILLWILAALTDASNAPVVVCFVIFLINDLYGFVNWRRMENQQRKGS